nr:hypothetical protein [Corallococcus sp. CA053C]
MRDFALWDSGDWRCLQTFVGHGEPVGTAAFVADERIVSISCDSTVQLWNAWTGEHLRTLETAPLYALAESTVRGDVAPFDRVSRRLRPGARQHRGGCSCTTERST